jgi:hypothetical protein
MDKVQTRQTFSHRYGVTFMTVVLPPEEYHEHAECGESDSELEWSDVSSVV